MCRRERELDMEEENIINSDSAAPSNVKTIKEEQNKSRGLFVHPNWIKEVANINWQLWAREKSVPKLIIKKITISVVLYNGIIFPMDNKNRNVSFLLFRVAFVSITLSG